MSAGGGGPEDAAERELAELLGDLERPQAEEEDAAALAFDDVRARIGADLDERQGSWRKQSALARYWPVALAALAGAAFALALSPASLSAPLALACALAGAAGAVALASILVSPSKPGRGERFAQLSLGLGVVALGLQAYGGLAEGGAGFVRCLPGALRCGSVFLVGGAIPLLALVFMLRRSGLPVRKTHAAALAVAAFAMSGLGVWRHCAPPDSWHVAVAHLALPLGATSATAFAVFWLLARARAR